MGQYKGKVEWRDSIYIVDPHTKIMGGSPEWSNDQGVAGFANISSAQLTDRTNFLRAEVNRVSYQISEALETFMLGENNLSEITDPAQARYRLGLGMVDNTRDKDKPVSDYQRVALNSKVDKVEGKQLSTEDFSTIEKVKLEGIALQATQNLPDNFLLARANHTGTQSISSIEGLQDELGKKQNTLEAGDNITIEDGVISAISSEYPLMDVFELLEGESVAPKTMNSKNINEFSTFVNLSGDVLNIDFNLGRNFSHTAGGNRTIPNPTNIKSGLTGDIVLTSSADRTLSFGSYWKFAGGDVPSIKANTWTVISYKVVNDDTIVCGFSEELK